MSEASWRQQTADRLRDLARSIQSWTPSVLYGAVTGCAILPLVSAAQQGAVPYDVVYQLLGAAGINLVTNLVQQWKDQGLVCGLTSCHCGRRRSALNLLAR